LHLAEVAIRDFAIVDFLRVEWTPGFNVLTGETGAGKSIIIDALGAALGDRLETQWVRSGSDRAWVEALFCLDAGWLAEAIPELGDLAAGDDESLALSRDISSGRSASRINARTVPVGMVQRVGERLIDMASQPSHLSLSRTREHLEMLDRYARLGDLRTEMARAARSLGTLRREIRALEEGERQTQREAALLRHEVAEIDGAVISPDEEDELAARRSRLKNASRLRQLATAAHDALQGSEEGHGAVDLLTLAGDRLQEIKALDPGFSADAERLPELTDLATDLSRALRLYADSAEEDPDALDGVEERLLTLGDLKRKFGSTLQDVVAYRDQATRRLGELEHREERVADLRQREEAEVAAAEAAAKALSAARRAAARSFEQAVEREMAELGLGGGHLVVELSWRPDPEGLLIAAIDGEVQGHLTQNSEPETRNSPPRAAWSETGVDGVEFLVSLNPGELPRPLARVASGGEMARLMLALKSVLSEVDDIPVLIFDEVDQGVGGRMGHVIGEKLWRLAQSRQVLCVTHLPQVAAYADAHYSVRKVVEEGRTTTRVDRLEREARVPELAAMLGGRHAGAAAHRSAEELLERAEDWKGTEIRSR
jgi:DNA repair protein RecN (Recombination protein N)